MRTTAATRGEPTGVDAGSPPVGSEDDERPAEAEHERAGQWADPAVDVEVEVAEDPARRRQPEHEGEREDDVEPGHRPFAPPPDDDGGHRPGDDEQGARDDRPAHRLSADEPRAERVQAPEQGAQAAPEPERRLVGVAEVLVELLDVARCAGHQVDERTGPREQADDDADADRREHPPGRAGRTGGDARRCASPMATVGPTTTARPASPRPGGAAGARGRGSRCGPAARSCRRTPPRAASSGRRRARTTPRTAGRRTAAGRSTGSRAG